MAGKKFFKAGSGILGGRRKKKKKPLYCKGLMGIMKKIQKKVEKIF